MALFLLVRSQLVCGGSNIWVWERLISGTSCSRVFRIWTAYLTWDQNFWPLFCLDQGNWGCPGACSLWTICWERHLCNTLHRCWFPVLPWQNLVSCSWVWQPETNGLWMCHCNMYFHGFWHGEVHAMYRSGQVHDVATLTVLLPKGLV